MAIVLLRRRKAIEEKPKKKLNTKCFCGASKPAIEEYCCWEHRLIGIKCKQWGIQMNLKVYAAHCIKLDEEQAQIERQMRLKYGSEHHCASYF